MKAGSREIESEGGRLKAGSRRLIDAFVGEGALMIKCLFEP